MIDPRFANAGAVPVDAGYGAQEMPPRRHRHRRRHRKHKHGIVGTSPLSRDESIHRVDPTEGGSVGTGYGVPYGAAGAGGFYQHQEYTSTSGEAERIPEQLVGQRSSSALNNEVSHVRPSISPVGAEARPRYESHHRHHHGSHGHRHHHHHHHGHVTTYVDHGHGNDDIVFIERGHQSRYNQGPPPGFEFKGMIQVQGSDKVIRRRHRSQGTGTRYIPRPVHVGPCPPGWQPVSIPIGSGYQCPPCPPGTALYTGQVGGGYGTLGSYGGSGYYNLGSSYPVPSSGQLVADYIVESSTGGYGYPGGYSYSGGYSSGSGFANEGDDDYFEEHHSGRPTIIEVWQRRPKSPAVVISRSCSRSRSRTRSPQHATAIELERLRSDILIAIERISQGFSSKIHLIGTDGGNQTQPIREIIERERGSGEVRVIVQPIQPVFYMPRQPDVTPHIQPIIPSILPPAPVPQPPPPPQVVYVPRNVYVPVIKPVFVPRERVVVRPQVIHVARPVLVDRPVPVTQRPIIIDRERPVPVPIRTAGVAKTGGARTIREEYVFRDNLPVAYGGRCPEYAGGINYGYMPTQQEHQYATSSIQEIFNNNPVPGPVYNVTARNTYGYTPRAAQFNLNQGSGVYGTYTDVIGTNNASVINDGLLNCTGPIEVLDTTINPNWQRTDQTALVQRFGRPAYDIVQRSQSAGGFGTGSGVVINGGGGFLANNASYTSLPIGNINNLGGIVQEVTAPIDPCINY
ncbi:unnamed protein product [Rotaria sp. Silwood1]|nr:unnamed protein product [Rotaria sp. Silwood1]CAF0860029.1 unnamed protein product [Rotaria sp. Silwood1]CAF3355480.1 unnamed protein product [Rotaria sp. Silwood1]CAF3379789.1 unnamed protein product [Rotaria sp. Silwood1]CAF3387174.1 unnamed protein product [Rotaria sp. Silwood1]